MKAHQIRKPYNSKTIEEKYEIIKHYESIENTGRGAKSKTIEKFKLSRISTLNSILANRDDICI